MDGTGEGEGGKDGEGGREGGKAAGHVERSKGFGYALRAITRGLRTLGRSVAGVARAYIELLGAWGRQQSRWPVASLSVGSGRAVVDPALGIKC